MEIMNKKEYMWALCETSANSDGWYDDHILIGIFIHDNATCAMWWDKYGDALVFFNKYGDLETFTINVKTEEEAQEIFSKCSNAKAAP